ncbi:MAG: carbohydrate kinase family protein [Victivallales bacterium]|nr:carbohydrate kinase family protein [Victivallales bacterium]
MLGVVGYLCVDMIPDLGPSPFAFVPGQLREIGGTPLFAGGSVANTGGSLCKLGLPTRLGALLGDDLFGGFLREFLHTLAPEENLFLKTISGEPTGQTIVLNPAGQDRMFLTCRGVNDQMTADSFRTFTEGLDLLHYGYPTLSRFMAQNNGAETIRLFQNAHEHGALTSLDLALPSPGTVFWTLDWMAFLKNVLPGTDLFCPSIDELRFMLKDQSSAPEALADATLQMGCHAVFLKMGAEGSLLKVADTDAAETALARFGSHEWRGVYKRVKPRPGPVVGTTGAGDSAIAGMLAGLHEGLSAARALDLANAVASYNVRVADSLSGIPTLAFLQKEGF